MIKELKNNSIRNRKKWPIRYILGFVLVVIFLFSNNFLYQHSLGFLGMKIGLVFKRSSENFSAWNEKVFGQQTISELKRENERLLLENVKLKEKMSLESIIPKKEEIKNDFKLEEALVVGRENFFDTPVMVLDKGLEKGLKPGMAVLDELGSMIGKIDQSFLKTSQVILTPNIESRIGATVLGLEHSGVLEGNKNLRAVLEMLPIESEIKIDQEVVTDNSNPDVPFGLVLGKVAEVRESNDHLFKEAVLTLLWESQKIRKVWVIIGRK